MAESGTPCPKCGWAPGAGERGEAPAARGASGLVWKIAGGVAVLFAAWAVFTPRPFIGSWRFRDTGEVLTITGGGWASVAPAKSGKVEQYRWQYTRRRDDREKDDYLMAPETPRLGRFDMTVSPDGRALTLQSKDGEGHVTATSMLDRT